MKIIQWRYNDSGDHVETQNFKKLKVQSITLKQR